MKLVRFWEVFVDNIKEVSANDRFKVIVERWVQTSYFSLPFTIFLFVDMCGFYFITEVKRLVESAPLECVFVCRAGLFKDFLVFPIYISTIVDVVG